MPKEVAEARSTLVSGSIEKKVNTGLHENITTLEGRSDDFALIGSSSS